MHVKNIFDHYQVVRGCHIATKEKKKLGAFRKECKSYCGNSVTDLKNINETSIVHY